MSVTARPLPVYLRVLIVVQAFTAYMTETKFLPEVKHNVGAFEVAALCLSVAAIVHYLGSGRRLQWHWVFLPYFVLLVVATISQTKLFGAESARMSYGLLSVVILMFTLTISLVLFNLLQTSERTADLFLQAVAISSGIIAVWVITDSILSGGAVNASGPFRNRAHAGIYMHATFWLVLVRINWPRTSDKERFCLYFVLAMLLYVVATAGRRSVYFALFMGFGALVLGGALSSRKVRRRITTLALTCAGTLTFVYVVLADFWEPAAFFRDRVGMVQSRLEAFAATSVEETSHDFIVLQRQGGMRAIRENPLLGIGYGGFPFSDYSPTGHEMHSTPMRFVAELGLSGVILYIWCTAAGMWLVFRNWRRAYGTAFEGAALALMVGMFASTVSYTYNRQMTDRTFWLLLAVAATMDVVVRRSRFTRPREVDMRKGAEVKARPFGGGNHGHNHRAAFQATARALLAHPQGDRRGDAGRNVGRRTFPK